MIELSNTTREAKLEGEIYVDIGLGEVNLTFPITIRFDYQPYEPPERGPEARYPGCEEAVAVDCYRIPDIRQMLRDQLEQANDRIAAVILANIRQQREEDMKEAA